MTHYRNGALALAIAATLVLTSSAQAGVVTYNGGWDSTPTAGDDIVIASGDLTWDSVSWGTSFASWTQQAGYTDTVTFDTTYTSGLTITGNADVLDGNWSHQANGSSQTNRLDISIGGDFNLAAGASILADGLGYSAGNGPGSASGRQSAGHGGLGGKDNSDQPTGDVYGSITDPTALGSGSTTAGGGAVLLNVGGTTTLDGTIAADGIAGNGPGSGGSVYLTTGSLTGSGTIRTNGGEGNGAGLISGGGGGRAAVVVTQAGQDFSSFAGSIEARSGAAETPAGAGTIYQQTGDQYQAGTTGTLIVDNGGNVTQQTRKNTLMPNGVDLADFAEVIVRNGGILAVDGDNPLDWANLNLTGGGSGTSRLFINSDDQITYPTTLTVDGYTLEFDDASIKTLQNLLVGSDGAIEATDAIQQLALTLTGDLTVQAGGSIAMNGGGPSGEPGEATLGSAAWVGGSYGGQGSEVNGVADSRPTYGSFLNPDDVGSYGADASRAAGGRVITLVVNGTTIVDGIISADGAGNRASGSGGTVNITTGEIAGSGTIRANGGVAPQGRADGGGGRVAVVLTEAGATFVTFDLAGGVIEARARVRNSSRSAAAGSVYRQAGDEAYGFGSVFIDNDGTTGATAVTALPPSEGLEDDLTHVPFYVRDAARLGLMGNAEIGGLDIDASALIDLAGFNVTVQWLTVDGTSYDPGTYSAGDFSSGVEDSSTGGTITVVPEPGTLALLGLGGLGLAIRRRRA